MEIIPRRDLVKDELGNYYEITKLNNEEVTLVNAAIYYSFNRILRHEFVDEVNKNYDHPVGVGQYFTDLLKNRISGLESGKYPGSVYPLEAIKDKYSIKVEGLYEQSVHITAGPGQ